MASNLELSDEEVFGPQGVPKELTDEEVFGVPEPVKRKGLLGDLTNIDNYTYPFRRASGVMEQEFKSGVQDIKEAFTPSYRAKDLIPSAIQTAAPTGFRVGKAALGAAGAAFSPITGALRGFVGEPVEQGAEQLGVSPESSQILGVGAELAALAGTPALIRKAGAEVISGGNKVLKKAIETPKELGVVSQKQVGEALTKKIQADIGPTEKAKLFLEADLSKVSVPLPSKDRQVNYANYLITTDDTKKAIFAAEKIRGSSKITVPWKKTEELAAQSNLTIKDLLKRGERDGVNTTQMEAFKSMMNAASRNVSSLRDKVLSGTATDADRAMFYAQFNEMMDMQRSFQGAKSEVGRALNVLKKNTGPDTAKMSMLKSLSDGKLLLKNGKKVEELGVNELAELLKAMESPEAIAKFVESASKATALEKVVWAWRANLLTGLRTHEVNLISNAFVDLLHYPERAVAAGLGKVLPRQNPQDKVFFREVPAMFTGMINGLKEGSILAAKTLRHGPSVESARKVTDVARLDPIGGTTGKVIGLPYRFLAAGDDVFRQTAKHMQMNALATRQAVQEGHKGEALGKRVVQIMDDPSEELVKAAEYFGEYSVFTKDLGPTGKAFQKLVQTHPSLTIPFPFIRTPVNIVKYAGERTPFSLASKAVRDELRKGGAARDTQLAKLIVGSGMSAWVVNETLDGNITGRGPVNPIERKRWYDAGYKPYSIRIGEKWYPFNRFEPVGILFGYASDSAEIMKAAKEDEKAKIGTMVAYAFSQNVTNKTWMQGMSNIVNAMSDPERYGDRAAESLVGSAVPTLLAEITHSRDPIIREIDTLYDAILSRIPEQFKKLYPRRDIYGQPLKRHEGGIEAFMASIPWQPKTDKAYTELNRLKIRIDNPERRVGGKELPIEIYDQYAKESGEMAKSYIDRFVSMPNYDKYPRLVKEEIIKKAFESSRKIVRSKMGLERKKIDESIEKVKEGLLNQ